MLSKTAMALLPAASLVGAAAVVPTTSLAQYRREPRFHRRQLSLLPGKTLGTASVEETLPPTLATSKEIEQSGVTNVTPRAN
jgi:hypothetical protein